MKVDLPAPFGPSSPVTPRGTSTDTSFNPITWPYHLETWSAATTGSVVSAIYVTTSTPRTLRSRTEIDTTIAAMMTRRDTCQGVTYRGFRRKITSTTCASASPSDSHDAAVVP